MTTAELPPDDDPSSLRLSELDDLLGDLYSRDDGVPQWEFCDGFLAALACTRRAVPAEEFLPVLLGDGELLVRAADGSLPVLPLFASAAQQSRFLELWQQRWDEVVVQLDGQAQALDDDDAYQPEFIDMRGALAGMDEAERAEAVSDGDVPSLAQMWALGFMFVVEHWADDWQPPRDKEDAAWLADALDSVDLLTEDDDAKPALNLYDEGGEASVSQERIEVLGEAIWAVYDLRRLWKSMGPRQFTIVKNAAPGRNDPCSCGSGKKYKKCCGA